MKKVLWVSRHMLGEDQLADLHRIYGDVVVVQFADTVESAKQLVEVGKDCDIFAVVLPPALLADLISPSINQKPVIRSVMERVPTGTMIVNPVTGKEEMEMAMHFVAWEQVDELRIVTHRLRFRSGVQRCRRNPASEGGVCVV